MWSTVRACHANIYLISLEWTAWNHLSSSWPFARSLLVFISYFAELVLVHLAWCAPFLIASSVMILPLRTSVPIFLQCICSHIFSSTGAASDFPNFLIIIFSYNAAYPSQQYYFGSHLLSRSFVTPNTLIHTTCLALDNPVWFFLNLVAFYFHIMCQKLLCFSDLRSCCNFMAESFSISLWKRSIDFNNRSIQPSVFTGHDF